MENEENCEEWNALIKAICEEAEDIIPAFGEARFDSTKFLKKMEEINGKNSTEIL